MDQFDALEQEERILRYIFDNMGIQHNVSPHIKDKYFQDKNIKNIIKNINFFITKFSKFPTAREFYSRLKDGETKTTFHKIMSTKVDSINPEEIYEVVEKFFQIRMTLDCLQSQLEAIQKGDTDAISSLIEPMAEAVNFKLESDIGYDIEDDIEEVLRQMLEVAGCVPSSMQFLNDKTKARTTAGGWYKKALSIVLGESGVGKSLVMCNEAAYAYRCGYNVLYISLELSRETIYQRISANLADINYKDIEVVDTSAIGMQASKIRQAMSANKIKQGGWLVVTDIESGSTALDIARIIREVELKKGAIPDLVVVDYIGEMGMVGASGNMKRPEALGMIARQLRNVARKYTTSVLTGSQVNRDAYGNTQDVGMKNTSDSAGLNHVSDLLVTITQDDALRIRQMYCHKIIKNRMGPKNDVFFTKVFWDYMRIKDCTEDDLAEYAAEMVSAEVTAPTSKYGTKQTTAELKIPQFG